MVRISILGQETIVVGHDLAGVVGKDLIATKPEISTYVIISDTTLARLGHIERFRQGFGDKRTLTYLLPPGEPTKSREVKSFIEDFLCANGCRRDSCLIALGGGVVGDLVGYVASTYMRGVPVVQIPTTLLSMVDSSIGGKTAIDTAYGKNIIGAFWQPFRIYIDVEFLRTLPTRQLVNGMAEVIKAAAAWDRNLFADLESNLAVLSACINRRSDMDMALFEDLIARAVMIKAEVVTLDEREGGLRGILNFGHSIGHAIEAVLFPMLLHGEAVAIGMTKESEIASLLGFLSPEAQGRLTRLISGYGLPTSLLDRRLKKIVGDVICDYAAIEPFLSMDKKNRGTRIKMALLECIGSIKDNVPLPVSTTILKLALSNGVVVNRPMSSLPAFEPSIPGSKSITNRALLMASLGSGECRLRGVLSSDDTAMMMSALVKLGACTFHWEDDGRTLVVKGRGGKLCPTTAEPIYVQNAGTASRFLTSVLCLCPPAGQVRSLILTGNERMKQRPIQHLVSALNANGASIRYLEQHQGLPIIVNLEKSQLCGGNIVMDGKTSSQFVSSLLMCAPFFKTQVTLSLDGDSLVSRPYVDMTIQMMKQFGIQVEEISRNCFRIPTGVYRNPRDYVIEPDASSATYPLAVAASRGTTCIVRHLGRSSLQGDSAFADHVLEPMGCTVDVQDHSITVTGPPPGQLKPLGTIDMGPVTDTFLTACVLAAQVPDGGVTEITGIANQRVKECDRIEAMSSQLAKYGVRTETSADGIKIFGSGPDLAMSPGKTVHCFDDHRVAMSFSVLGGRIEEKACTAKTWPTWWQTLRNEIGYEISGCDFEGAKQPESLPKGDTEQVESSMLLIGMRGVGKTILGRAAANSFDWKFKDMDQEFLAHSQTSIRAFIDERGWPEFRCQELRLLKDVIGACPTNTIISCGGGIVESPEGREYLMSLHKHHQVIFLKRPIKQIEKEVVESNQRPDYGSPFSQVWERREELYRQCSTLEYLIIRGEQGVDTPWNDQVASFTRWLRFSKIWSRDDCQLDCWSSFLSLTFPAVRDITSIVSDLEAGVEAVELRVDLLALDENCPSFLDQLEEEVALLHHIAEAPVILTLRSQEQGGKSKRASETSFLQDYLSRALRWGVRYIDIEDTWLEKLREIPSRPSFAKLIVSHHGKTKYDHMLLEKLACMATHADILKFVSTNGPGETDHHLLADTRRLVERLIRKPFISLNMGEAGQMSRITNKHLTPVTHPLMPSAAAPGQLTVRQLFQARSLMGQITRKHFFLFGSPIRASFSPVLHNTGFKALGLPYEYLLHESSEVPPRSVIQDNPLFGGASVTIPLKVVMVDQVDWLSKSARAIGAVNTLYWDPERRFLKGDNTDWKGIRRVMGYPQGETNHSVLVLGAGGTARAALYACQDFAAVHLWNRSPARAEELKKTFEFLEIVEDPSTLEVDTVISTLPGNASLPSLPSSSGIKVCVDLAYNPRQTPIMKWAREAKIPRVGEGIDVLIEQGFDQFWLWTGKRPPYSEMRQAVMRRYEDAFGPL